MKQLLCLLLLVISGLAKAQISGTIIDRKTQEPLPFVNIGLLGKSIGTVSNEKGVFKLNTAETNSNDTLVISSLGYKKLSYPLKMFVAKYGQENIKVQLDEESISLREVAIVPKKIINKTLGNTTNSKVVSLGFSSNDLGSEIGVPMHVKKHRRCFIDTLFFSIDTNKYDSVLFRVNIYSMKNGKPDSSLLAKPLYSVLKMKAGTLKIDVTSLYLETNDDFFVSLEWLQDLGKKALMFPAGVANAHAFARNASHGKWFKLPFGIGFYCKTRQEK